jgi:hypothetical protein
VRASGRLLSCGNRANPLGPARAGTFLTVDVLGEWNSWFTTAPIVSAQRLRALVSCRLFRSCGGCTVPTSSACTCWRTRSAGLANRNQALVWLRTDAPTCSSASTTPPTTLERSHSPLASPLSCSATAPGPRPWNCTPPPPVWQGLGDRNGEAAVHNHSGRLHRKLEDPKQALAHYQRALELARAVGSPLDPPGSV